ncbi:MAG TPA: diaminopimelate decarboxylase [Pseudonocardiaceae bacterium]|nr:diaminopimelate decarboxylase [Pseudonocardiaceae bacterium]
MTLAELLPSLGASVQPRLAPGIWPAATHPVDGGDLSFAGVPMTHLAARFGTPCTLLDEDEVRRRARAYRHALPGAEVAFASKSLPCKAVLRWLAEEGLSLDVCSAGELAVARSVGFPAERIMLHGNVKTAEDLKAALSYRVGRIVIDSLDEIDQLAAQVSFPQSVLIRVTPGVDAHTHKAIATGVEDQKFGFSLASGAADEAIAKVLNTPGLRLVGLHCHIGSQVRRIDSYEQAAKRMVELIARVRDVHGVVIEELDLGGGFAAPYRDGDGEFDLPGFAHRVLGTLNLECALRELRTPRLTIEPGRSIVANAGVTLYRAVTVKHGTRTFVAVDGGMSDNPRPALYGARYEARRIGRQASRAPLRPATVVGRHCEAGDVIAEDIPLPEDIRAGDLLAVPCTGAYHYALASNYNLVCRPPLVGVRDGEARLLVRRETEEDVLARDLG